jgi:hypothetical protein
MNTTLQRLIAAVAAALVLGGAAVPAYACPGTPIIRDRG